MNKIAIAFAIQVNDQKIYAALPNVAWPTMATLKALVRFKLADLKRKVSDVLEMAMAIIPLPEMPVAA